MSAPWQGFAVPPVEEMCPCEAMPVIAWKRDRVILVHPLDGADPHQDAADYNAGGFQQWWIHCPTCGKVYSAGSTP